MKPFMKEILNNWYENTIIPSIVLGCITTIICYIVNWVVVGMDCATIGQFVFAFIFFLIVITIDDFITKLQCN